MQIKERNYRERRLNHLLYFRKELLEKVVSSVLINFELEKSHYGMFVDLFGLHKSKGLPVFIETQIGQMDPVHFHKIVSLIDSINDGIIIWISTETTNKFDEQLKFLIEKSEKLIEVLIIEMNADFIIELETLRFDESPTTYERFINPDFNLPQLQIKKKISNIPNDFMGVSLSLNTPIYSEIEKENRKLLHQLRVTYPYYINVIRAKSNLDRRQIQIGSGLSYIEIVLAPTSSPTKEAFLVVRSTNHSSLGKFKALKLKLSETSFTSKISEDEKSFSINYGNSKAINSIINEMVFDFGQVISVLTDF